MFNKITCIFFVFFISIAGFTLFAGCKSTGAGADINRIIIEHSIEVERSQAIQRELIATIDRGTERLNAIGRQAELLSGNIGEIIELFTEYDRIVRQLIAELKSITAGFNSGEGKSQSKE